MADTIGKYTAEQLERLLVAAEEAGDQQSCDEIMLQLYMLSQAEAIELYEAAKHGKYPAWMYEGTAA